jgi:hypothetical protein
MYMRVLTTMTPSGISRRHSSSPTVSGDGFILPIRARRPYILAAPFLYPIIMLSDTDPVKHKKAGVQRHPSKFCANTSERRDEDARIALCAR